MVVFDAHHDTAPLDQPCMEEIHLIRESEYTIEKLTLLCRDELSELNDDWIHAGIKLGLIENSIIFGVQHSYPYAKGIDNLTKEKIHIL